MNFFVSLGTSEITCMSSDLKKINYGSPPIMFSVGYMNKTIADGIALTPIITPVALK
jgi:hypothetical protein